MSDETTFNQHCILELMGHQRIAGKVSEQVIAGTAFLRIDVPKVDGIAAFTKFYSASAVYSITPVDEAICLRAVAGYRERPIETWRLSPEMPLLEDTIVEDEELDRKIDDRMVSQDCDSDGYSGDGPEPDDQEEEIAINRLGVSGKYAQLLEDPENMVILDTETSGLDKKTDQPLSITVIDGTGKVLFDERLKPTVPISDGATDVHGITEDDLKDAPTFDKVYDRFIAAIEGKKIVAYNATYDFMMITNAAHAHNIEGKSPIFPIGSLDNWRCAMHDYAEHNGTLNEWGKPKWWKLIDACANEGIPVEDAHTALGDCKMTLALIKKMGTIEIAV